MSAKMLLKRTEFHGHRSVVIPRVNRAAPENTGSKIGKGRKVDFWIVGREIDSCGVFGRREIGVP
jgi:3D (Asp-Asp-Asp) domain-containing protein